MAFQNILQNQVYEFNKSYHAVCKRCPSESISEKQRLALRAMLLRRCNPEEMAITLLNPFKAADKWQYLVEVLATTEEVTNGINRYYVKDESLFDFFKQTDVRKKEVDTLIKSLDEIESSISNYDEFEQYLGKRVWGVLGQKESYTIVYMKLRNSKHTITVLANNMNYTLCVDDFDPKVNPGDEWVFNLVCNFLFYIQAFPECVIDGVPNGVKRNPSAKSISISDKIVAHKTVEHGFVRPHFRSGYFRHMDSDWYVNCKGQVRFIASTMVKGRAKTVISRGEINESKSFS